MVTEEELRRIVDENKLILSQKAEYDISIKTLAYLLERKKEIFPPNPLRYCTEDGILYDHTFKKRLLEVGYPIPPELVFQDGTKITTGICFECCKKHGYATE